MDIEPFEVVELSDRRELEQAIIRTILRGNPIAPTPTRDTFPKPVVLKYAKVKSLSAFEKTSQCWQLSKDKGAYLIVPYRPGKHGGSEEEPERGEAIPAEEPLERVVHRLVERALASSK